jgi:hypothetical protein
MPWSATVINVLAVAPKVLSSIGQKGQVSGTFDSYGQSPLVLCTGSRLTPRLDFPSIGEKATQKVGLLVIYDINLVCTKGAYPTPGDVFGCLNAPSLLASGIPSLLGIPVLFVCQSYLPISLTLVRKGKARRC